jgi:hypothetical protein
VAIGSTSGTVQVEQGGETSNSLPFNIDTATITSVTPTSGLAGTQVTITGSGFGATQGNGMVWLGTASGVVTNWSDGQITANVASGSASGTAQVLQSGVWSNSVPFAINVPQITSVSPTQVSQVLSSRLPEVLSEALKEAVIFGLEIPMAQWWAGATRNYWRV